MTAAIHHHELPNVVVVIGVDMTTGMFEMVSRPQFAVCDGDEAVFLMVATSTSRDLCDAYARRCAELLERHGLTDVPDDIGAEVSDV
jgi:hypothetical protein